MKHEIEISQPEYLVEDWPGKYDVFSWLEYVVTIPNPIYLVTTRKANGASVSPHSNTFPNVLKLFLLMHLITMRSQKLVLPWNHPR